MVLYTIWKRNTVKLAMELLTKLFCITAISIPQN